MSTETNTEKIGKRSVFNRDLLTACICLAVSCLYMYCARTYPNLNPDYLEVSASFFPTLVASVMIICSLSMLVKAIVKPKIYEPITPEKKRGLLRGILTILVCLLYVLAFKPLGYIPSSMLAVFAVMIIFGNRRWPVIIAVTIIFPILLYAAFRYGLKIKLPVGILTFLK